MPPLGPSSWTVAEVCGWLEKELQLPPKLAEEFRTNAVTGADLLTLSDDDLTQELHCTSLQARKIRNALTKLGFAPPAAAAAAAPAVAPQTPAAPAAPPAPAASEPDPRSCFAAADLQRYRQLKDAIAGLQALQIPSKVDQARQYSHKVKASLDQAQQALAASRKGHEEAEAEHQKLVVDDKWYPGKVLGGKGKQEEKKAAAEAKLKAATQQLRGAEQQVSALQAQLQEAQKQLAAWQGKDSELSAARRDLEQLVERMFAAPAWRAAPKMAAISDATRALEAEASEAARGVTTYGRGTQLLNSATQNLQGALEALSRTQAMGMAELITIRRNDFMMNMMELGLYRKANEACQAAARDCVEARNILGSGLPTIDRDILDAARRGLFTQMLLGGTISDVMQLAAIRKSIEQVQRMLGQTREAASWAQSNLAVYQHKDAELKGKATAHRRELEDLRQEALRTALEAAPAGKGAVPPVEQLNLL